MTKEEIIHLIEIQNKTHHSGFIRSLERAGILRSMTGWQRMNRTVVDDEPIVVASFNPGRRVQYGLYSIDQAEGEENEKVGLDV